MHHSVSPGSEMPPGSATMREARRWRVTPYRHRVSLRGAGTDFFRAGHILWKSGGNARVRAPVVRNPLNFRGFPHMPGDDWALSYPGHGESNDGTSLIGK